MIAPVLVALLVLALVGLEVLRELQATGREIDRDRDLDLE